MRLSLAGHRFTGLSPAAAKALWKLNWFLHDFGYDTELLGCDEIDDKSLTGLSGVVKITHTVSHGTSLLNLEGFGSSQPAGRAVGWNWQRSFSSKEGILTYSYSQISHLRELPAQVPAPLFRRLARKGHPRSHALRTRL
jgi:hypothetical protein